MKRNKNDLAASIQFTIVDYLIKKLKAASKKTGIKQIAIAGGVSANSELRNTLHTIKEEMGWDVFIPKFEYTTDNAAMIAINGYFKFSNKEFSSQDIAPYARISI